MKKMCLKREGDWVVVRVRPVRLGNSMGFIIRKAAMRLERDRLYVLKIIDYSKYDE